MTRLNDFYRDLPVLVAGADGFLGTSCLLALQALGARLTAMTRRGEPRAAGFQGRVVRGDLNDADAAARAVADQQIVFDFVGDSGPVRSNVLGAAGLTTDCGPHVNLFMACSRCVPPPLVVFCSSRLVYGKPQYLPVDEQHPLQPECFYAVHKLMLEHYLHVLSRTTDLGYIVVRLSNPYGLQATTSPNGRTIANQFIRLARQGRTLTLYGSGDQHRDYIYVDDAINAFLSCAATAKCRNHTFNLGGARSISLRQAAELIVRRFGGRIETVPWPADYWLIETGDYQTDLSKLVRFVGLQPPRTFEEGLAQMPAE